MNTRDELPVTLRRLRLQDGDVLLVRVHGDCSADYAKSIRERIAAEIAPTGMQVQILIVDDIADIRQLREVPQ